MGLTTKGVVVKNILTQCKYVLIRFQRMKIKMEKECDLSVGTHALREYKRLSIAILGLEMATGLDAAQLYATDSKKAGKN